MNFLAHAFLAADEPALIVGGVVGDWIKGNLPAGLPADLARGVALHRAIDSHAELHPAFVRSRARVSAARRRYAGVLVDVFYDHLLARDWDALYDEPLSQFSARVYRFIAERMDELPVHSHFAQRMMAQEDWFSSYSTSEGIADVLARMSRRARRPNPLTGGEQELLADLEGFDADFRDWLADAKTYVAQWRAAHREA